MIKKTVYRDIKIKLKPYGVNFLEDGFIEFNFWAPDAQDVKLCLKNDDKILEFEMSKTKEGLYSFVTNQFLEGDLYCYRINNDLNVPDPASRYQPDDVHGFSQLINPEKFNWEGDFSWKGRPWEETVLYELHVGTFTPEGTFNAIKNKLDYLVSLGVTAIELMPVNEFPGKRNWGYDGVLLYAPESCYGTPDELKELIKEAHKKGIQVFLDVVYNHFGPDGNYLYVYANSKFFNDKIKIPWGDAINFKEKLVREFFINNAIYWLNEYHFDGLRFDAFHEVYDDSSPDFIQELFTKIKSSVSKDRHIHLVMENDKNQAKYLEDYTAQWNDDFHHCVHILATRENEGYYADYAEEKGGNKTSYFLARTLTEGFAYQGEKSFYRGNALRGEKSSHLPLSNFVNFIQNHDQVGNRAFGERFPLLSNHNLIKAAAGIYLLAPSVPLLFMGEEWGSESSFYFFCNFNEELSNAVRKGRREEFSRFPQFSDPEIRETIPDPSLEKTFLDSKLNWNDLKESKHKEMLNYYKDLLLVRRDKIVPIINNIKSRSFSTYTDAAFCAKWEFGQKTLMLLANLGNIPVATDLCINKEDIIFISRNEIVEEIINNKTLPPEIIIWIIC